MDAPIVAVISAFNEADIIAQVVGDLIRQRVAVYVLDNHSTDDTAERVGAYLGRGVLGIERFPPPSDGGAGIYEWERILRRKEELSHELDAKWFIHHDADEFREGPWDGLDLRASIERVDRLGYNAIDFELLNFWPTHEHWTPDCDIRDAFVHYEPGEIWNKTQIRCWKKTGGRVDLASTGGHEALFPGRRVFPLRFLLRHYPIRSDAHGARKVFGERQPRFTAAERARGWHVQYQQYAPDRTFLRDPAALTPYDPEKVRVDLCLRHRDVERLAGSPEAQQHFDDQNARYRAHLEQDLDVCYRTLRQVEGDLDTRNHEVLAAREDLAAVSRELDTRNHEIEHLHQQLDERHRAHLDTEQHAAQLSTRLDGALRQLAALEGDLDARNREVLTLHDALHRRNVEVAALRAELDIIHGSFWWRAVGAFSRRAR